MGTTKTTSGTSFWTRIFSPGASMTRSMQPESGPYIGSVREFYTLLDVYYQSNALYDNLRAMANAGVIESDAIKGLRNPAHRIVEFYAKKMWSGTLPNALPILAKNERIVEPIHQVWQWSNFTAVKQIIAREAALYGDCFLKVATVNNADKSAKRVFLQRIDPKFVTTFRRDERQFITMIRLDMPIYGDPEYDTNIRVRTRTEIWDKQQVRIWIHDKGENALVRNLDFPDETYALASFGIDFVPFVHAPFLDIGDLRGVSSFQHSLDKIDEVNLAATRLHRMLYRNNKSTFVLESTALNPAGQPMPALDMGDLGDPVEVTIEDETMFSLPGSYHLNSLVPQLPYNDALNILQAAMQELEDDQPEMAYYRTRDLGARLSGVALRLMLGPAIDTVTEARGNMESMLIRANQMALTVGMAVGLFPDTLGTFEAGDFDHSFSERPVIALTELEDAQVAQTKQAIGVPASQTLLELGYTKEQVMEWEAAKQQAATEQLARLQVQRQQLALTQDQAAQAQQGTGGIQDRIQRSGGNLPGTPPPGTPAHA